MRVAVVGISGIEAGGASQKTAEAVIVIMAAAEHDHVIKPEFEGRQRLEDEVLAKKIRVREVPVAGIVHFPEDKLRAELAEITKEPRQQERMNVLQAQGRKRRRIVALREGVEITDSPPHLLETERDCEVAEARDGGCRYRLKPADSRRVMGQRTRQSAVGIAGEKAARTGPSVEARDFIAARRRGQAIIVRQQRCRLFGIDAALLLRTDRAGLPAPRVAVGIDVLQLHPLERMG